MAYLGHFPDDDPPDDSWSDEPEDALDQPAEGSGDNVRTLDFSRSWGDPDTP